MLSMEQLVLFFFFFLNDPATPEIYPFPLPPSLPLSRSVASGWRRGPPSLPDCCRPSRRHRWPFPQKYRARSLARAGCRCSSRSRCATSRETQDARSEEHTSELQSQSNLVCRLLLEKK